MSHDYKLRREIRGEVYLGSHEQNQPPRIILTQSQPSVRAALIKLGHSEEQIDELISGYEIYFPVTVLKDSSPPSLKKLKKLKPKVEEVVVEPDPEPAVEEVEDLAKTNPSEAEDLELEESADMVIPSPKEIKEMNRNELEALSERFEKLDEIPGSGANGYRTVSDFRRFLMPWAEKQLK